MDLSDVFQTIIYSLKMCLPKWRASGSAMTEAELSNKIYKKWKEYARNGDELFQNFWGFCFSQTTNERQGN